MKTAVVAYKEAHAKYEANKESEDAKADYDKATAAVLAAALTVEVDQLPG